MTGSDYPVIELACLMVMKDFLFRDADSPEHWVQSLEKLYQEMNNNDSWGSTYPISKYESIIKVLQLEGMFMRFIQKVKAFCLGGFGSYFEKFLRVHISVSGDSNPCPTSLPSGFIEIIIEKWKFFVNSVDLSSLVFDTSLFSNCVSKSPNFYFPLGTVNSHN